MDQTQAPVCKVCVQFPWPSLFNFYFFVSISNIKISSKNRYGKLLYRHFKISRYAQTIAVFHLLLMAEVDFFNFFFAIYLFIFFNFPFALYINSVVYKVVRGDLLQAFNMLWIYFQLILLTNAPTLTFIYLLIWGNTHWCSRLFLALYSGVTLVVLRGPNRGQQQAP